MSYSKTCCNKAIIPKVHSNFKIVRSYSFHPKLYIEPGPTIKKTISGPTKSLYMNIIKIKIKRKLSPHFRKFPSWDVGTNSPLPT